MFGDSNTYGLIHLNKKNGIKKISADRILQQKLKEKDAALWERVDSCGRTTVFEDELRKK